MYARVGTSIFCTADFDCIRIRDEYLEESNTLEYYRDHFTNVIARQICTLPTLLESDIYVKITPTPLTVTKDCDGFLQVCKTDVVSDQLLILEHGVNNNYNIYELLYKIE